MVPESAIAIVASEMDPIGWTGTGVT